MNTKEISDKIKTRQATVDVYLQEFKEDNKVKQLDTGELTIPQFIELIDDNDPYKIFEIYENKYQVLNKKAMIPLQGKIPPDKVKDIYDNYDIMTKAYPEIKPYIEYSKHKIKEGCSSCNKNGFTFNAINLMVQLGGHHRNLDGFNNVFGTIFTKELAKKEPEPKFDVNKHIKMLIESFDKSQAPKPVEATSLAPQPFKGIGARQSCKNCILKHLSQALINHHESLNAYPLHKWVSVGHLAEAETEAIDSFPDFTKKVREARVKYMEEGTAPDFMELIRLADSL